MAYPSSVIAFSVKADEVDTNEAAHINDLQTEVEAVESALLNGFQHVIRPLTHNERDLGTASFRWRDLFLGRDAVIAGTLGVTGTLSALGALTVNGKLSANSTAADALDVAGGAEFGSGNVALIGTDGKINGPLSSTIIDNLSGANLTNLNASQLDSGSVPVARLATFGSRERFRGLHLRTHPDATVAVSKVLLTHADEIVMSDGTLLTDWDNLEADITAGGAGGLDISSEVASTWYSIHAIAKEDGTKALLLHREKHYLEDTAFTTTTNAGRALRLATSTATDKLSQGVTFASGGPFAFVDVELIRAGSVSGTIWFSLQASSSGDASGVELARSDKINAAQISASNQRVRLIFRTPNSPAAATQFHIVLEGDYTRSDSVNITWRGVAAGGYAGGVAREFNGTVWANASGVGDFNFRAFTVQNDAAITLPSGYTKSAKIGYARNDDSSNFRPFTAIDRTVRFHAPPASGTFTSTLMLLTSFETALPPIPVVVRMVCGLGAAGDLIFVSPIPDGFGLTGATGEGGHASAAPSFASSSSPSATLQDIHTITQAIYVRTSGGTAQVWLYGFTW